MNKILNDSFIGKILKTFFEGFLAYLIVTVPAINTATDCNILKSVLFGAITMGISAVLNLIQEVLNGKGNS